MEYNQYYIYDKKPINLMGMPLVDSQIDIINKVV